MKYFRLLIVVIFFTFLSVPGLVYAEEAKQCSCTVSFEPSVVLKAAAGNCNVKDLKLVSGTNVQVTLAQLYNAIPTSQCSDKQKIKQEAEKAGLKMSKAIVIKDTSCASGAFNEVKSLLPSALGTLTGSCKLVTGETENVKSSVISSTGGSSGGGSSSGGSGGASPGVVTIINPIGGTEANPKGIIDIPTILGNVLKSITGLIGSFALVGIMAGGFIWMTSAGESEKVRRGLQTMLYSAVGMFVIFSSYAILVTILGSLGLSGGGTDGGFLDSTNVVGDESCKAVDGGEWQCIKIDDERCKVIAPSDADIEAQREICKNNPKSCKLNKCHGNFNAKNIVCCNVNPSAGGGAKDDGSAAEVCEQTYGESYGFSCNEYEYGCVKTSDTPGLLAAAHSVEKKGKVSTKAKEKYRINGLCKGSNYCCVPNEYSNSDGSNGCEKTYGNQSNGKGGLYCGKLTRGEPACDTSNSAKLQIEELYFEVGIGRLVSQGAAIQGQGFCPAQTVCCVPKGLLDAVPGQEARRVCSLTNVTIKHEGMVPPNCTQPNTFTYVRDARSTTADFLAAASLNDCANGLASLAGEAIAQEFLREEITVQCPLSGTWYETVLSDLTSVTIGGRTVLD